MPEIPAELLNELLSRMDHRERHALAMKHSKPDWLVTVDGMLAYSDLPPGVQEEVWWRFEEAAETEPAMPGYERVKLYGLESVDVKYEVSRTFRVKANGHKEAVDAAMLVAQQEHLMSDLSAHSVKMLEHSAPDGGKLACLLLGIPAEAG